MKENSRELYSENVWEKNKWSFDSPKELFSKLKQSEWVLEDFFVKQLNEFKEKNKDGYNILEN